MLVETQNLRLYKFRDIGYQYHHVTRYVPRPVMVKNVAQPDIWVARHFYKILFSMERIHFTTLMEDDEPSSKRITTIFTPWKGLSLWAPMML